MLSWQPRRSAQIILLVLVALANPTSSRADFIYAVSADTTHIQGLTGSFDLQFNPGGLGTLPATATITSFLTNGTGLSLNATDGDVTGTLLPGPLVINNTFAINDWLENITFGTNLSFTLTISGTAVNSPNPSLPGSNFGLTLYDSSFNPLLTVDPAGTVVTIDLNPDGTTTAYTFASDNSGGAPVGRADLEGGNVAPEPASMTLLASGLMALGVWARARRIRRKRLPSAG